MCETRNRTYFGHAPNDFEGGLSLSWKIQKKCRRRGDFVSEQSVIKLVVWTWEWPPACLNDADSLEENPSYISRDKECGSLALP